MNNLFANKRKNTLAICFTSIYTLFLILTFNFNAAYFSLNFRYALNSLFIDLTSLITPVLVLIFLLTLKKEYRFKKWLFPIAFGVTFARSLVSLISSFNTLKYAITTPLYLVIYLCSWLMLITLALMFVGTLFEFKYLNLLKFGALGYIVLSFTVQVIEFINVGGIAYFQNIPQGIAPINFVALIKLVAQLLFYIGIFILTLKNKNIAK